MSKLYAGHASEEFNLRLHKMLQRFTADIQSVLGENLVALVLAGSYGRGEGAVFEVNGIERPYNDLDFALIVKRKGAVPAAELAAVCRRYMEQAGLDFELGRPLTVRDVRRWEPTGYWYGLFHGHRVLTGPGDIILANAPDIFRKPLPVFEAARLLVNRGSGLLWAMRVLRGLEPSPDHDFVRRNYYKCVLALGDAALLAHQRFSPEYRGRDALLDQLSKDVPRVAALQLNDSYRVALQFKFRPNDVPGAATMDEAALRSQAERWGEVLLYVESQRFGREWRSMDEYVRWSGLRDRCEHDGLMKLLRNIVRNRQIGRCSWRYPREMFYRRLPVLLGLAGPPPDDWPGETSHFLWMWSRFL
jgi:hypothetical protein